MAQRHHHYERAFEDYLRRRRLPYIAVNEARKTLLPRDNWGGAGDAAASLKSFDFVVYTARGGLLVDVKGRKLSRGGRGGGAPPRLESWVTEEDVDSLTAWLRLFGLNFAAGFVFLYWCPAQPPDGAFQDVFAYEERWYAAMSVELAAYRRAMIPRSPRWRTVQVPAAAFAKISQPFRGAPAAMPEAAKRKSSDRGRQAPPPRQGKWEPRPRRLVV